MTLDSLTEQVIEQLAAVLVGMEPIIEIWLQPGVDMPVVQLSIENQENRV